MHPREVIARYLSVMGQDRSHKADDLVAASLSLGLFRVPHPSRTLPRWHTFLGHADVLLAQIAQSHESLAIALSALPPEPRTEFDTMASLD